MLNEVNLMKLMNGKHNTIKLFEVFENRNSIFIVSEYFEGKDFMKIMKKRRGLPFTEQEII